MASSVEKLNGLKHRLSITVPAETVEQAFTARIKELTKTIKMKGFRAGKVPAHLLEQQHGKSVFQEVVHDVVRTALETAVEQQDLKVAGQFYAPHMIQAERRQELQYTVEFETYPEIELQIPRGESVTRFTAEISEQDIDEQLITLQKEHAKWESVERAAQMDDRVVIDFEGSIDGQLFERGSAKEFRFELGGGSMLPDFEAGVMGMQSGETKEVGVDFPKDYQSAELAGKHAVFKIFVREVLEPQLPELDEAFIKAHCSPCETLQDVRLEIRKNLEKNAEQLLQKQLKMTVLEKLLEKNTFEIPDSLVETEIKHLQRKAKQQLAQEMRIPEKEVENLQLPRQLYEEEAKKRVRLGLLLGEVVKHYQITIKKEDVEAQVEKMTEAYENRETIRNAIYHNKTLMMEMETVVLEDRGVEHLLNELQIHDQTIPYKEAMEQTHQHQHETD